jgi:uncharacterized membrane protein YdjX (TVP38/TMEM64 family)
VGPWAYVVVFLCLQAVAQPFLTGYTPLIILSGFLFGWWALLLVYPSVFFGCVWSNLAVRSPFFAKRIRGYLEQKRWFELLHAEVQQRSFVSVLLLRWSPLHYGLTNCVFGVVTVPLWVYLLASAVGVLDTVVYVSVGTSIKEATQITDPGDTGALEWILLAMQVIITVLIIAGLAIVSRRVSRRLKMEEDSPPLSERAVQTDSSSLVDCDLEACPSETVSSSASDDSRSGDFRRNSSDRER